MDAAIKSEPGVNPSDSSSSTQPLEQVDSSNAPPSASSSSSRSSRSSATSGLFQITPLYPSDAGHLSPRASLLRIDDFCLLLDCGWDERFDVRSLEPIIHSLNEIDAVIVSYPDLQHMGALPYLIRHKGLSAPVLCSMPAIKLGRVFLEDALCSFAKWRSGRSITSLSLEELEALIANELSSSSSDIPFSLEDIKKSFDTFIGVKIGQPTRFETISKKLIPTFSSSSESAE
jgi:hypothetical protein